MLMFYTAYKYTVLRYLLYLKTFFLICCNNDKPTEHTANKLTQTKIHIFAKIFLHRSFVRFVRLSQIACQFLCLDMHTGDYFFRKARGFYVFELTIARIDRYL